MENVAFDLVKHYPPVPIPPYASGEIKSVPFDLCVDAKYKPAHGTIALDTCISKDNKISGEQASFRFMPDLNLGL